MKIYLPQQFDMYKLSLFFKELDSTIDLPSVTIDFSTLSYSYPTAMLVAGSKLRKWVQYRIHKQYKSIPIGIDHNKSVHSYLMHLGFFDFIYLDEGKSIGEARGNSKYLPITRINIPPFIPTEQSLRDWHQIIMDKSSNLVSVLSSIHHNSEEHNVYSYAIREVIRNVFEHSQVNECYICGQRWVDGRAEIAIIDEGFGISNSIRTAYNIESDMQALEMAILPGTTRTIKLTEQQNTYDNSGFGLYILSNLAASFGWFVIGSGNATLIGLENTNRISQRLSFSGTFFGMQLNSYPKNFRSVLQDIISEGEREIGQSDALRKASGLSKFVS